MNKKKHTTRLTKEDKRAIDAAEYWNVLEQFLPWKLYGWTFKEHAQFFTGGSRQQLLELTGEQRDQIVAALGQAHQDGYESCCGKGPSE